MWGAYKCIDLVPQFNTEELRSGHKKLRTEWYKIVADKRRYSGDKGGVGRQT